MFIFLSFLDFSTGAVQWSGNMHTNLCCGIFHDCKLETVTPNFLYFDKLNFGCGTHFGNFTVANFTDLRECILNNYTKILKDI